MNNQQRVLAQLSLEYGRTASGIAFSARLTAREVSAALSILADRGLAVERESLWYLVEPENAA